MTNKAAAASTFNHLDALDLSLSNERARMAAAETEGERNLRSVWVRQLEKEVAQERAFLGLPERAENEGISDDDLLANLGM